MEFYREQKIEIDPQDFLNLLDVIQADKNYYLSDYQKGSLGGRRINFIDEENLLYYVDVTPEEEELLKVGTIPSIYELPDFEERKRRYHLQREIK